MHSFIKVCHSISVRLRSGLWVFATLGFIFSQLFCYEVTGGHEIIVVLQWWTLAFRHIASHLTQKHSVIEAIFLFLVCIVNLHLTSLLSFKHLNWECMKGCLVLCRKEALTFPLKCFYVFSCYARQQARTKLVKVLRGSYCIMGGQGYY